MHRASILGKTASGKGADNELLLLCCDNLRVLLGVSSHTSSGIGFSQRSVLVSGVISFRLGIRWISLLLFFFSNQTVESPKFHRNHALHHCIRKDHPDTLDVH
jgi:hypothetical protein